MTFAARYTLPLLLAASAIAISVSPAPAQDSLGRISPDSVLMTPNGEILDYIPEASEVRTMRDARGRTVLVDNFGNVIATVMGSRHRGDDANRRTSSPDGTGAVRDYRTYRQPDDMTGSVQDFGEPAFNPSFSNVLPGVEREPLPSNMPAPVDENDMAALPAETPHVPGVSLPPAAAIGNKSRAEITALQVFLDREGFSPGVIDGKTGSNVTKAIEAWQQATGETLDPNNTEDILERLRLNGGLPITSYTITAADAAGPYVASIPEDYAHKAVLPELSFTSTTEMLGEKFHMDEDYLKELNPGVNFTIPGTIIKVIIPGEVKTGKVARIVADKGRKQVFAYDESGGLISAYPASIGSSDTPSPSGTVQVDRIAFNPGYTYNPKINFKQGDNDKVLTIPPGPNGPVGTVWIALSKPTYGIHGTPEPSKIGKTQSHGCVRLTNWDATELAKMVSVGTTVEFVD